MQRFRNVKIVLRIGNQTRVGNVTSIVEIGTKELDEIHTLLYGDPLNQDLIQVEREALQNQVEYV